MITLRYHFLTIAAIFLSLGLGIILGGSIGQNWMNEKEQAILGELEVKYDKAMQNNEALQQRLNLLTMQLQDSNAVNSDHTIDLQGRKIGVWEQTGSKTDDLKQVLTDAGLEIIELGEKQPKSVISFPVIFVGESVPDWSKQIGSNQVIHFKQSLTSPFERTNLLRSIQRLYKENKHEY